MSEIKVKTYRGVDFSDGLRHYKYVKREMVNGKWKYIYGTQVAGAPGKKPHIEEKVKFKDKKKDKSKHSDKEKDKVIDDVIDGKYGNGEDRVKALKKAGYDYEEIQNGVNKKLKNPTVVKKKVEGQIKAEMAKTKGKFEGTIEPGMSKTREKAKQKLRAQAKIEKLIQKRRMLQMKELR